VRFSRRVRDRVPGQVTRRRRRRWPLVTAGALLVAAALGGWLMLRPAAAETTTQTATVSSGTFKTTVTATGTVNPAREKELTFPSGGTVTAVLAEAGDKVDQGEVLARMDAGAVDAERDAAAASLDAARTQLADDLAAGASSTQLASDRASVTSAASQLAQAKDAVAAAALRAPFSGTVSSVGVAVGDSTGTSSGSGASGTSGGGQGGQGGSTSTSASTSSTSTSAGVTVISTSSYVVDASVGSSDVGQLKDGMQADITPTGSSVTVHGVVESVGVVADTSTTGAATFPVTIRVTGSTQGLYPGSSASVAITVKQVDNVLTVPTQAVTSTNGKTYVNVVAGTTTTRKAITIGQTYGFQTEVTKGLSAGDKVKLPSFQAGSAGTRTGGGNQQGTFPGGGFRGGGFPQGGGFGGAQ
jgi:multidrug efflux pump subunit AcrA (membrane-fusion protein)